MAATAPIRPPGALLRVDPATGVLKVRRYRVTVLSGPDAGRVEPLEGTRVVGSQPGVGLSLTDDTVSRYHLELQCRADGIRFRDLASTNGTFIGDMRIQEVIAPCPVTVQIGQSQLRISLEEEEQPLPDGPTAFGKARGLSAEMRRLFAVLERVGPTDSSVLLLGETGTGKEVLARGVHQASPRAPRPFVVVDCGAIPALLMESELFGHIKGAFTGAVADRKGAFLAADGGSVFLDEIGELPLELQPKLLRFLESGTVKRVGEDQPREVDARVISATHRDLLAEVKAGRFREDLYFRLAVVPLRVPPLRERRQDLPLLVEHFLTELGRAMVPLAPLLISRMEAYDWPGNVRELRNVIERALTTPELDPLPLEGRMRNANPKTPGEWAGVPFKEAKERLIETFTRGYLETLLDRNKGNVSRTARAAGLARNYVQRLVQKYDLKAKGEE